MPPKTAAFLSLARVSNLPTVWSNVLLGWWLGGVHHAAALGLLLVGGSLLYAAGTTLNDAFDAEFDRRHRPERPIPSGLLSRGMVGAVGGFYLLAGAGLLVFARANLLLIGLLAACIVVYDAVHKRTQMGVLLMAGCRFLLPLVAASHPGWTLTSDLLRPAAGLGLYVAGITLLARGESTGGRWRPAALPLLAAPFLLAPAYPLTAPFLACGVAWTGWALFALIPLRRPTAPVGPAIGKLLAGIALLDSWYLSSVAPFPLAAAALVFFFTALALQRRIAAT